MTKYPNLDKVLKELESYAQFTTTEHGYFEIQEFLTDKLTEAYQEGHDQGMEIMADNIDQWMETSYCVHQKKLTESCDDCGRAVL
jgi:hypothetical protein